LPAEESHNVALQAGANLVTSVKLVEIREWSWGATTGGVASGKGGLRQGRDRRHGGLCCGRSAAIKPCAFGAPLRGCGA